jgi:hypothetical protein
LFSKPHSGDILVANVIRQVKKSPVRATVSQTFDYKLSPLQGFFQMKTDFAIKMPPQMGLKYFTNFKSNFPAPAPCF